MKGRLLFLAALLLMFFITSCGDEVQKVELVEHEREVHYIDLKWPINTTISYDITVTSSTAFYYYREGEEVKEYDINVMCNLGFLNNPNWSMDYTDNVCEKPRIGTAPYHYLIENFGGNLDFHIYGKLTQDSLPCETGCVKKNVYYLTTLQLLGDFFRKDIYKSAWFYDSNQGDWIYIDDVIEDSDYNFTSAAMADFHLSMSRNGVWYVDSSNIRNADRNYWVGEIPEPLDAFVYMFNVGKYKPWDDSAWILSPDSYMGIGIGKYEGKSYISLMYNGKKKTITTYKVLMITTGNSPAVVNNYITDCLDREFTSTYGSSATSVSFSQDPQGEDCFAAVFPMGEYYWDSHNLLMKEVVKIIRPEIIEAGYDCEYVDGNGNSRRVSGATVNYDDSGNPQGQFGNCNPDDIKKYVAYKLETIYVKLEATEWIQK